MVPALQHGEKRHLNAFGTGRHIEKEKSNSRFWAVDTEKLAGRLQGSGTASKRGREGKRTCGVVIPSIILDDGCTPMQVAVRLLGMARSKGHIDEGKLD